MNYRVVLFDQPVTSREELLQTFVQTPWEALLVPNPTDLRLAREYVAQATAFIGNEFPGALTADAGQLRLIHCPGAGIDLFDLTMIPRGCALCNVYEHEIPIAEYIIMCVLMFATGVRAADAELRQGGWSTSARNDGAFHAEAFGATLGLIGFGHIGAATARRAKAMGMRVAAVRRRPEPHPDLDWCGSMNELSTLLSQSDYVAIVCPLTTETRGLLQEPQLRQLKKTAVLINPARAAIVDEVALYRALHEHWFAGAALDVWYQYPPTPGATTHGSQYPFHGLPNVLVTPHFSAWTESMIHRRYQKIAANLDHLARGEPLDRVVHQA